MIQKIGEMLVNEGLVTLEQLNQALEAQQQSGDLLGSILIRLGFVEESVMVEFLSKQFQLPAVDPMKLSIEKDVLDLLPTKLVQKFQVIPIAILDNTLNVAMVDPRNLFIIDDIRFLTRKNVRVNVAPDSSIRKIIDQHYSSGESIQAFMGQMRDEFSVEVVESRDESDLASLEIAAEQAPVVKLVNLIMMDAVRKQASDIHIEPYEKMIRVRFRIDGVLYEIMRPPLQLRNAIISRVKIMSRMDIAERRLPQDGRIKLKIGVREIDFRVSVLPTLFGEKVVLRLLDKSSLQLDMTKLGFEESQLQHIHDAIYSPYGMVLVTGPTGSGKTTTLYSALAELNKVGQNISTAEDPVEYNLPGINQLQIHEIIGLNFATALRAFLRQDPDIIMVGEVRDFETAEVAIKAALTGHLVLSTLHTNDAPSSINRLLNMGVEPFLVSSAINLILAQRLVRRICSECRAEEKAPPEALLAMGVLEEELNDFVPYYGRGCPTCNNTGYRGRTALYEVMPMSEEIRELALVSASARDIRREAIQKGMISLRRSGINKLKQGVTSMEEVVRTSARDVI
jgi:type IV pilus assembly protein PilB